MPKMNKRTAASRPVKPTTIMLDLEPEPFFWIDEPSGRTVMKTVRLTAKSKAWAEQQAEKFGVYQYGFIENLILQDIVLWWVGQKRPSFADCVRDLAPDVKQALEAASGKTGWSMEELIEECLRARYGSGARL
jgi:hypothetical protein